MCKGVNIRGEEIKAHAKKNRDADGSDEEGPSDHQGGSMRREVGKRADRDSKSGKAKNWFVGC